MDLYPIYHVTFSFKFYFPPKQDELCGLTSLWIDKRRGVIQVIKAFAEDQMSSVVPVLIVKEDKIMMVVLQVILLAKD